MCEFRRIESNFAFVLMTFLNFSCIIITEFTYDNTVKYASNEKTQGVGYKYGGFRGSVSMGIPVSLRTDTVCEQVM